MKKLILILFCILLSAGTGFSQEIGYVVGIGAAYNFYPTEGSLFGDLAVLSNMRADLHFSMLFTFADNISFGPEIDVAYFTLKEDTLGINLNMFDFSTRGIFNFQISKLALKPYFGYSPTLWTAQSNMLMEHFLEAGIRVSAVGIYVDGSFCMSMSGGDHHFKAGLGYEIRF